MHPLLPCALTAWAAAGLAGVVCSDSPFEAVRPRRTQAHLSSHTHTHTHAHSHAHSHSHSHAHTHTHARTHTHMHTHTRVHTLARTHTHARTHAHTHARTRRCSADSLRAATRQVAAARLRRQVGHICAGTGWAPPATATAAAAQLRSCSTAESQIEKGARRLKIE